MESLPADCIKFMTRDPSYGIPFEVDTAYLPEHNHLHGPHQRQIATDPVDASQQMTVCPFDRSHVFIRRKLPWHFARCGVRRAIEKNGGVLHHC